MTKNMIKNIEPKLEENKILFKNLICSELNEIN